MKKLNKRPLYVADILKWADFHRESTGNSPTQSSGIVLKQPMETWARVDAALREGTRGA